MLAPEIVRGILGVYEYINKSEIDEKTREGVSGFSAICSSLPSDDVRNSWPSFNVGMSARVTVFFFRDHDMMCSVFLVVLLLLCRGCEEIVVIDPKEMESRKTDIGMMPSFYFLS